MDRAEGLRLLALTSELCAFATGVVRPDDERLFARLARELPLRLHRYPSGSTHNGWVVPQGWRVERATISRDGRVLVDATQHALGVGVYSRSFSGELGLEELRPHIVTDAARPDAYVYHCVWQYRPWAADWAISVPHRLFRDWGPGRYRIDLDTTYAPGEMLVADLEVPGASTDTIVLNAHTCHPVMANDDFAGVAVLVRLFQWLARRSNHYTYRLVLGPEHLGTVFYLKDRGADEVARFVSGAFAEMPGTANPVTVASSFLGGQPIDRAFANAARHGSAAWRAVPWRRGAGNDETVWEAPGYEVPFVEVSRARTFVEPYPEYHTSLDTPAIMTEEQLEEFYLVFQRAITILEEDARVFRRFDGLLCLSNPEYDLYLERPDPAVAKELDDDADKWGHLLDCLFRYLDGSMTILEIAERHDLPFDRLHRYLTRFRDKGLVHFERAPIERRPVSRPHA